MAKVNGMNNLDWVAIILIIIGALNWGMVGIFNYNLVEQLLPSLANIIYALVGVAGVLSVVRLVQYRNQGY